MGLLRMRDYVRGLPEDSALITHLRRPHEDRARLKGNLDKQLAAAFGKGG